LRETKNASAGIAPTRQANCPVGSDPAFLNATSRSRSNKRRANKFCGAFFAGVFNMTEISSSLFFAIYRQLPILRWSGRRNTRRSPQRKCAMSPEERQLLSDLFERVRSQANAPRDRDAENFIADAVRSQPYAPYLLAQAVIVQEQALHAADQKLQELQAQVSHLQAEAQAQSQAQAERPSSGGFLGGLFGGGAPAPRQAPPPPPPQPSQSANPWGAPPQQQAYAPPPPPGGPWGQPPAQGGFGGAPQPQQGGGFLKGALGAAAGVAGGVLLADSIRNLVGGGHAGGLGGAAGLGGLGGAAGLGGLGGTGTGTGTGAGGGETVVNNYYEDGKPGDDSNDDSDDDQDASDDDYSGGDDDYSDDV
jgi:uncharacterized protein